MGHCLITRRGGGGTTSSTNLPTLNAAYPVERLFPRINRKIVKTIEILKKTLKNFLKTFKIVQKFLIKIAYFQLFLQ